MKTLAKDTWQIACQNWKNILLFELLYRMVTMPAYLRLISRGVRLPLRKPDTAISQQGISEDFSFVRGRF